MNHLKQKIQVVYIPFLLTALAIILGYSGLRWLLEIKFNILHLKDEVLNFWIPSVLAMGGAILILRKRVRILKVGTDGRVHFLYQMVAGIAIVAPLIIAQTYVSKASYPLIKVNTISEIDRSKRGRYYAIKNFEVDTMQTLAYATARTSGRNSDKLTYYFYILCAMPDTTTGVPNTWYGIKYTEGLSTNTSDAQKDTIYRSFIHASLQSFREKDFHQVTYFENLPPSDDRDGYINAFKEQDTRADIKAQLILQPSSEVFEARAGDSLSWVLKAFGIGALVFFLMVVIPGVYEDELNDFRDHTQYDDMPEFLELLVPQGDHFMLSLLAGINVLVFIVMSLAGVNIISPTTDELFTWGGLSREAVTGGQYWRLLTSMFVHSGIMHLFGNIYGLVVACIMLEPVLKRVRLIIIYIIAGIAASCVSMWWHPDAVAVGASGAIFGLYGVALSFLVTKTFPKAISSTYWVLIVIYGGLSLLFGLAGNVDNAAHLGGLATGFIAGLLLYKKIKEQQPPDPETDDEEDTNFSKEAQGL